VFPAGKHDKAAGLLVLEGYIKKGLYTRLTRNDVIVSKTSVASLRRFKDDVAEVRAGLECGVVLEGTNDIRRAIRWKSSRSRCASARCNPARSVETGRNERAASRGEPPFCMAGRLESGRGAVMTPPGS
jgi:hypothetical protein